MNSNALVHLVMHEWVTNNLSKGRFTWGPKFQVPSPTHVGKSQLLSLKKPLNYG